MSSIIKYIGLVRCLNCYIYAIPVTHMFTVQFQLSGNTYPIHTLRCQIKIILHESSITDNDPGVKTEPPFCLCYSSGTAYLC